MSYLYYPALRDEHGKHSLEAWGFRFGIPKVKHEDWENFSPEMLERCSVDVDITLRVFEVLTKRMRERGFSEKSCELEHQIRIVVDEQERTGFKFDIPNAEILVKTIRDEQERFGEQIKELFPRRLVPVKQFKYRTRQDGSPYSSFGRHLEEYPRLEFSPDRSEYTIFDWEEFNIGSPKQRAERLLELAWKPQKFTDGGQPKTDEDALVAFLDVLRDRRNGIKDDTYLEEEDQTYQAVKAMSGWIVNQGRATMIEGWLKQINRWDSCIHGAVNPTGASSRRAIHFNPNTANIPSNEAKWGRECRSLWTSRPGRVLLGGDAQAVQMRMFGHYLGNLEVAQMYIEGDPHTRNAEACEIPRPKVKNVFYAMIFGAQDKKLGTTGIPNGTAKDGERFRKALYRTTPGFEELVSSVTREYYDNGGFVKCVDGGFVRCPSPHAVLNYKIQSAEAVLMKEVCVQVFKQGGKLGLDFLQVGFIHDEIQYDVNRKDAEKLGQLFKKVMREAGETFNFLVPMEGSYKIGDNWSMTH